MTEKNTPVIDREEMGQVLNKCLSVEPATRAKNEPRDESALTYMPWADVWQAVLQVDPLAKWDVYTYFRDKDGVLHRGSVHDNNMEQVGDPYFTDANGFLYVGAWCSMFGVTRSCTLPVLDHRNNAMKAVEYKKLFRKKDGSEYEVVVAGADAQDINRAGQRCKVKAAALFGVGLSAYAIGDAGAYEVAADEADIRFVKERLAKDGIMAVQMLKVLKANNVGNPRTFDALNERELQWVEKYLDQYEAKKDEEAPEAVEEPAEAAEEPVKAKKTSKAKKSSKKDENGAGRPTESPEVASEVADVTEAEEKAHFEYYSKVTERLQDNGLTEDQVVGSINKKYGLKLKLLSEADDGVLKSVEDMLDNLEAQKKAS